MSAFNFSPDRSPGGRLLRPRSSLAALIGAASAPVLPHLRLPQTRAVESAQRGSHSVEQPIDVGRGAPQRFHHRYPLECVRADVEHDRVQFAATTAEPKRFRHSAAEVGPLVFGGSEIAASTSRQRRSDPSRAAGRATALDAGRGTAGRGRGRGGR